MEKDNINLILIQNEDKVSYTLRKLFFNIQIRPNPIVGLKTPINLITELFNSERAVEIIEPIKAFEKLTSYLDIVDPDIKDKNSSRINHNYISIKYSLDKNKSKIDKKEKRIESKESNNLINYKEKNNNINANKFLSPTNSASNINKSSSNLVDIKKNNVNILFKTTIENEKISPNENNIINNNYYTMRKSLIVNDDNKTQMNNNDSKEKKGIITTQINNHSILVTYGSTTSKNPMEKKEKENGNKDPNINDINSKTNYSNFKTIINNNININTININNTNAEEKKTNNSTIDNTNIDKNTKEIKFKKNHTLYVSINSKK
jgi:hypothetical protein